MPCWFPTCEVWVVRSLILLSRPSQVVTVPALPMWSHTHLWSYPFTPVGTQHRLQPFRGYFFIVWVICGSRAPIFQSCSCTHVSIHFCCKPRAASGAPGFEPKLWENIDLQTCSVGLELEMLSRSNTPCISVLLSMSGICWICLDMNSSAFKGEKVIFPTLPGSHLSAEYHNILGVAKVARVI